MSLRQPSLSLVLFGAITLGAASVPAQVCTGSVTLSSQAEVNAFSCTSVTGFLRITGADITDLTPLSGLTSVGSVLFVSDNGSLTNLDGLGGLTSVGTLHVTGNGALTNLDGLGGVTSVGTLNLLNNGALTNLDGLSGLTSVGTLNLSLNGALTNLDGLSGLTSVGALTVSGNGSLTNLDGLGGLTSVGGDLTVSNNGALTNLDGLSGLTSVGGALTVSTNPALTNLDGLSGLTSHGGDLTVLANFSLTSFCGLYPLFANGGPAGTLVLMNNLVNPTGFQIVVAGPCSPVGSFGLFAQSNCDAGRVLTLAGNPHPGGTVHAVMTGFSGQLPFVTWGFGTTTQLFSNCNCELLSLATQWQFGNAISLTVPSDPFFLGFLIKAQGADVNVPASSGCASIPAAFTDVQLVTVGN